MRPDYSNWELSTARANTAWRLMRTLGMRGNQVSQVEQTAYHEAGHAVIAYRFGAFRRERGVLIDSFAPGAGRAYVRPLADTAFAPLARKAGGMTWRDWVHDAEIDIHVALAGPIAEIRHQRGRSPSGIISGHSEDLKSAGSLARIICSDTNPDPYLYSLHKSVRRMLREPRTWGAVCDLARALTLTRFASGEEVDQICERRKVPPVSPRWRR